MRQYERQFDRQAQEGLIRALVHMARVGKEDQSYVVITTAPSQWLPYCSSDKITLLDISGIVGATSWSSESDTRDRILAKCHTAGWPDNRLSLDYKVIESSGTTRRSIEADLVLTDATGQPVAVFEFARPTALFGPARERVRHVAHALGVTHAFVTDGERIFRCGLGESTLPVECPFPSPEDLDSGNALTAEESGQAPSTSATVITCATIGDLRLALTQRTDSPIIIDFTLPWGIFDRGLLDQIRSALPAALQTIRYRDMGAAMLSLVASSYQADKRVVAVVPPSVMFTSLYANLRDYLVERFGLVGVIQLPSLPLVFETSIAPFIVAFGDYPLRGLHKTAFISLTNRGDIVDPDSGVWWTALSGGLSGKPMSVGIVTPIPVGQPWTGIEERQEAQAAIQQLNRLATTVPLGELCKVHLGFGHQPLTESAVGVGIPVIRGRDLSSSGLTKEDLQWYQTEGTLPDHVKVKQGDVLIQRVGMSPKCLVVGAEIAGAVASNSVLIVRPSDPRANPQLICQFLRSLAGRRLLTLHAPTTVAPTLSPHALQQVPIPLLDHDTFRDLDELEQVESDLRSRADKIASLRLGLFSAASQQELKRRLEDYRLLATSLRSSLRQADTLPFQVHNFYPFPLAYSYRMIGSRVGTETLYKVQLRVTENILAFLGSLTLALLEPGDHQAVRDPNPRWSETLTLQCYWENGISPGHWRDICVRGAKVLSTYHSNELALALGALWAKGSDFPKHIKDLIEAKNDFKHDRDPDDEESIQQASSEVQKHLDMVMRDLAFLTRFPISLVRDLDIPRGTRTVILRTSDYVGDHPEHPSGRYEYNAPLPKNDLFIQVRSDLWLPLFPFLTVHSCPSCRARETYFVDRWFVSKHEAKLKSFERGHAEDSQDVACSLDEW